MKNVSIVVLIVVAGLAAWFWRQEGISRARAEAAIQSYADSLLVVRSAHEAELVLHEASRERFASDTLRLTNQLTNQRLTISRLRASGDSLERVLALDTSATPGDSLAAYRQIAATRLQEARSCGIALVVSDSLFTGCTSLLARSDSIIVAERNLRLATERLAEQYRRLSKPSIFQKVAKGLPWLGVGAGIVCLLKC